MGLIGLFGGGAANPVAVSVAENVAAEEIARANQIAQRWRIYHGEHKKPLRVRAGQPDDNVIINYCRVIVDKGVSFLFGQEPQFELDETGRTPAEEWLEACWSANRKATFLQRLALSGAIGGHAFVKIVPATMPGSYPRLVILDPATVTPTWQPDDIEKVTRYRIQYPAVDRTGKPMVIRQLIELDGAVWRVTDQVSREGSAQWETTADATWPHPWPPIVDTQNMPCPHEYWGISDLEEDVLQLNRALNFVLSNLARIIRYHAHPKTWGKGFAAKQLDVAVDETIVLPSTDAELRNLEMVSDLSSSISVYERLREALHEVARVPEVATGKLDRAGALSGVALRILYQPLLEKTESKRRTYGDLLVELNRRLLALGGFGDENRTLIYWPELLPVDARMEAETALLHQQLGASADTLLQRLGFDPDVERAKREAGGRQLAEGLLTAFDRGER